jgi:hypothetical protein
MKDKLLMSPPSYPFDWKSKYPRLEIRHAENLAKALGDEGVIIIAFGRGGQIKGVSYGETKLSCRMYGKMLDKIIDHMEGGKL